MEAVRSVCESAHPVAQDLEIQGNVLYCLTRSAPAGEAHGTTRAIQRTKA